MKIKPMLLALMSLSLFSCQQNKTPDTPKTEEKDEGNKNNPGGGDSSDKENPSVTPVDPKPDTGDEGEKKDPETEKKDPDHETEDENTTDWDDTTWELMKKHLGGNVLPYIYLGNYLESKWEIDSTDGNYLSIGGSISLDDALVASFTEKYTKEGWKVEPSTTGTGATATLESKNLSVTLKTDSYEMASLKAYYDEPYDETSLTSWPSDVVTAFNDYINCHVLPFVYLGTVGPTIEWKSTANKLIITGGKWDERMYQNAKTAFKDWAPTESSDSYSSILTAKKTMDDGCEISVTIDATDSTTHPMAVYTVTIKEGYNSSGYTKWNSGFDAYKTSLGGHDVPAIYLGTSSPTYGDSSLSSYNKLYVYGKEWNDKILMDAKALLDKDTSWYYDDQTINGKPGILAYTTFKDGCRIQFTVGVQYLSTTPMMVIHYEEPYTKTATSSAWSDTVMNAMSANLGAGSVPYVYLNSDDIETSWSDEKHTLTLTGGTTFNSGLVEKIDQTFTKDGWKTTQTMTIDGTDFSATKTFSNGDTLIATMEANSAFNSKAVLKIRLQEGFNVPDSGKWPDKVDTSMVTNFYGYSLPYFYLGTKVPTADFYSSSKILTIKGVTWDDRIYTLFEDALKKQSEDTSSPVTWAFETKTDDKVGKKILATGTNTDGKIYNVSLYKSTDGVPTVEMYLTESFVVPTGGAWTSATETLMNDNFENHVAPFVYLGKTDPYCFKSSSTPNAVLGFTGGTWTNTVIDTASESLKKDGFEVSIGADSYGKTVGAYRMNDDGTSFRYYIYKENSTATARIKMYLYYGKALGTSTSTATDWDQTAKDLLVSNLGGYALPYLNLGTSTVTLSKQSTTGGVTLKVDTSTNKDLNQTYIYTITSALKNKDKDWNFTFDYVTSLKNGYVGVVYGKLVQSDGSKIILAASLSSTSYGYFNFAYEPSYNAPVDGAWSTDIKTKMSEILDGVVVPYIYLGKDNDKLTVKQTYSTGLISIKGGSWNEKMITSAVSALEADTVTSWSIGYDYSTPGFTALIATAASPSGYHLTLKLYPTINSTYKTSTACLDIYCV